MNSKRIIELLKAKLEYFIYPLVLVLAYYFGSKEYGMLTTIRVFATFFCVFALIYNLFILVQVVKAFTKKKKYPVSGKEKSFIWGSSAIVIILFIWLFGREGRILIGIFVGIYSSIILIWSLYLKRKCLLYKSDCKLMYHYEKALLSISL